MKKAYLSLFLYFFIQTLYGQYQIGIIPRISPDKGVSQKIGYTEVEIKYGSPAVSDRVIWGELIPYNEVWRAGANNATTVHFSSAVMMDEMALDSGQYSLFVIPKEDESWVLIFNRTPKQWGAFKYDESMDALRLKVRPNPSKIKSENLIYSINQKGFNNGFIVLSWDLIELEIPFETNYLSDFEREIESRASAQPEYIKWIPYIQGADHLEELNADLDLALEWIDKAEEIMNSTTEWNEQFYPRDYVKAHLFWVKAKLLARKEKFSEAVECVLLLKGLENTSFYDKENTPEEIDVLEHFWKGK